MKHIKGFISLLLLATSTCALAQDPVFYNNDCYVAVTAGGVLHVNGDLWNDGTVAVIENQGTITTENNGTKPASVYLENSSNMFGDGLYRVEQDWVNSATFAADQSTVELYSSATQQFITSKNATTTTFHNLTLTGTGTGNARKKSLNLTASEPLSTSISSYIDATGTLTINDRELDTDTNTMYVLNPSVNAVINTTGTVGSEGFVSSLGEGSLSRVTNSAAGYLFPTGSSVTTTRYRPVILTPANANSNTYTVRMVNFPTPDVDKIDSAVICKVQPDYFHKINHTNGSTAADIDIFYLPATDGTWFGQAQWQLPTAGFWNNMGTATHTTGASYNDVEIPAWTNFNNDSIALIRLIPASPTMLCVDSICPWTDGNVFMAQGDGPTFNWSSPVGTNIISGQGTNSVIIDWNDTSGYVFANQVDANGCISPFDSCLVNMAPVPLAGFDTASRGIFNNDWMFTDTSNGATTYAWYFGDGDSSFLTDPLHRYKLPGTYTVTQVVWNQHGCLDTIYHEVEVKEGIIVPNVFTPNDDGINDEFYIPGFGVVQFYIEIYDRWGLKMFEANANEIRWDGTTLAGKKAPDGTYYFVLKAELYSGKNFDQTGFLQLISQGSVY